MRDHAPNTHTHTHTHTCACTWFTWCCLIMQMCLSCIPYYTRQWGLTLYIFAIMTIPCCAYNN